MFDKKPKQTKEEAKVEADRQLFSEALKLFREEYAKLVDKYGIVHGVRWTQPTDLSPQMPYITEVWVKHKIDEAKQKKINEENVVVKN